MLVVVHKEIALSWQVKCGKGIGPRCASLAEDPNVSVEGVNELIMIIGSAGDNHEVLINKDVLHLAVWHEGIFGNEGWWLTDNPIILIHAVAIA